MTESEKWAIWTLGVVALTLIAWFALTAWSGNGLVSNAAFSLLALTAIPRNSRRHFIKGARFDEREQAIANRALLAGFRGVWLALTAVWLAAGLTKGWSGTLVLPVWVLTSSLLWAVVLLLTVESVTTLALYRR
ncbi:MAG TPA: hypothetical protein VN893_12675 [Bryobacteraceae bacterium]|nr:hypothetical protein [Bryobacteraceae bacterium]